MTNLFFDNLKDLSWKDLPWNDIRKHVFKLQTAIYNAMLNKELGILHSLQELFLKDYSVRLLSLYIVVNHQDVKKKINSRNFSISYFKNQLLEANRIEISSIDSLILWDQKNNFKSKNVSAKLLFTLLVDLSKQVIVKMVLEPQWEANFFHHIYGFRPGRSHHDALEELYTNLHNEEQVIANINLCKSFLTMDNFKLLKMINAHPIIEKKIQEWLEQGLIKEYVYQSLSVDRHIFDTPKGVILAPLLINIALNEMLLIINSNIIKHPSQLNKTNIICYGPHFLIMSQSRFCIQQSIEIIQVWLQYSGMSLSSRHFDVKFIRNGFNFLNYYIGYCHSKNKNSLFNIVPSTQAIQLLNHGNREIIQSLKSGPIKILIKHLRSRIIDWGNAYATYGSKQAFLNIDKVLFSQLRAAILRRHPNKSKSWIKQKYFPSNTTYYFQKKYYHASWILTDTSSLAQEFLPKIQWIRRKHYIKVLDKKSVYDEDSQYWKERL
uniref:putative reverse transcriptase/maturase n=1 Tax=Sahlingia subintegra TaxID=468936 RepID=UPI001FCD5874|nr:putative reverse transcriptase/maturase [Sahlingia subintegra]UNJ17346.1 putative reverse transcriptase/maturase [Sahlingia subintegra]